MSKFYDQHIRGFRVPHSIRRWGYNADVDTAAIEILWPAGGAFARLSAADEATIVSSDADDDGSPVGAGARTVTIYGVNGDYQHASETVTMNGVGAVTTTAKFLGVNDAVVATAGASATNEGLLTLADQAATGTQQCVAALHGKSQSPLYHLGLRQEGYVVRWGGCMVKYGSAVTETATLNLCIYEGTGTVKTVVDSITLNWNAPVFHEPIPFRIPEKSVVFVEAAASADNQGIWGGFDLAIVPPTSV